MVHKSQKLCMHKKSNPTKNMWCIPFDPFAVFGNVFGIEKFAGRRVLAELMFTHRAAVHERLSDYRQA